MRTNLLGRSVAVVQADPEQRRHLGNVGRVAAVSQDGQYFRVLVAFPRSHMATFDGCDLLVLSPWRRLLVALGLVRFVPKA